MLQSMCRQFLISRVRLSLVATLTLLTAFMPGAMRAQTAGEGTIEGTVTDSTGAAVPNATITATNTATHVEAVRTSSSSGVYVIAPLNPGLYTVKIEAKGFTGLLQENLDVTPLNILAYNPVLKIGSATETLTITDAPPVLDTDSATLGAVIENESYSALPLFISTTSERDPTAFATLVQGAQPGVDGRLPSLSGTPGHQAALYLDGLPSETLNQQGDNRTIALAMDVDAVDQFQVMTSVPPVTYMGAGAENFTMKSGGLQFHGSASIFVRNTVFDTYSFSNRALGLPKAIEHTTEGSATGGGYIPHTGKKLFFFLAYDKFHGRAGTSAVTATIPTNLEELGDFTQLNQSTNAITSTGITGLPGDPSAGGTNKPFLYDPTTNACTASGCTRQPFMGLKNGIPTYNVIPTADISDISKKLQSNLPNYPGSPNAAHAGNINPNLIQNNYTNQGTNGRDNYLWNWRWDYDLSSRNRLSTVGVMGHDVYATNFSNFFTDAPYTVGNQPIIVPKQYTAEDAYTLTSHLTNQFKFGYTRFYMPLLAPFQGVAGYQPGDYGITNLPGGQGAQDFPQVNFGASNFSNGTKIANTTWGATPSTQSTQLTIPNNYALVDNLQYLKGSHVMTFGFTFQWEGLNNANPATLTSIIPLTYRQSATANYIASSQNIDGSPTSTGGTGYGYASFLIGAVDPISGYNLSYAPTQYTRSKLAAPYVQDSWKVTKKLVLDLGLRWDYIPPVHEKAIKLPAGDFTFSYMNPTAINPGGGFPGTLEFAGNYGGGTGSVSCGCVTPVQTYWKNWGPRIGIVYSVNSKTVFRTGFGITYSQGGGTGGGLLSGGVGGANSSGQTLGAGTTATSVTNVASGINAGPSFWLSSNSAYLGAQANTSLFGPGFTYPGPPVPGAATQSLNAGNYLDANNKVVTPGPMGYVDLYQSGRAPTYTFFNLGFERSITKDMTLNVAYVGSVSHHTYNKGSSAVRGYYSNQLDPKYLLGLGAVGGNNSAGKANSIPVLLGPATSANVAIVNAAMPGAISVTAPGVNNFINAANASPATSSLTVGQLLVAFPQYLSVADSWGGPNTLNFSYNALQIILSQRVSRNLSFNINYTYQKNIGDDGSYRSGFDIPAGAVDGSNQAWHQNRIDRARTALDLTENVVAYGVYKLPFGKGGMGSDSWVVRTLAGGWQLSGVYTYGSGGPVNVTWSGGCTNNPIGGTNCLPSYNPSFTGDVRQNGSYGTGPNGVVYNNRNTIQYLNPAAFTAPKDLSTFTDATKGPVFHQYLIGNVSRSAPFGLRNPGNQNANASLRRSFPLFHEAALVFQVDCQNLWNKQTWGGPNGGWGFTQPVANGPITYTTTFGNSGVPGNLRVFQFSGHIKF